jgi:hypothetical protein
MFNSLENLKIKIIQPAGANYKIIAVIIRKTNLKVKYKIIAKNKFPTKIINIKHKVEFRYNDKDVNRRLRLRLQYHSTTN